MAKRKRTTLDKAQMLTAEKFISKLATTLSKRYGPKLPQDDHIADAFQKAVSALAAGGALQETLQKHVAVYTKLLRAQWVEQLNIVEVSANLTKRPRLSTHAELCITTQQDKPDRMTDCNNSRGLQYEQCMQWLASTLELQTGSDRGAQLQLDNCLRVVQSMLQSAVVHGMPLPIVEAQRIQAVLAQLLTVCFLQSKAAAQPNLPQSSQAQQQLLAQVVAIAAELQQVLVGRSLEHHIALAAYDMRSVGCHCQAMFELLLSSDVSSSLPPNSQEAEMLWTTLYQAAVSCIPKGISPLEYLLVVSAAEKASRMTKHNSSEVKALLAVIPVPGSLLTWLLQQSPSTVAGECQRAAQKGAFALTNYFLNSAKADALSSLRYSVLAYNQSAKAVDRVHKLDAMLYHVDGTGESAFGRGWTDAEGAVSQDQAKGLELSPGPGGLHDTIDSE